MTVWYIVVHEVQTYTTLGIIDERCTSLRLRLHRGDFCAYGTGLVRDGIQVQRCGSSIFSDDILVDFLRNEAAAIAASVVVYVIDQSRALVEDNMTSRALDLLHFGVVLFVSVNDSHRLEPRPRAHLPHVTLLAPITTKILATDITANVHVALDLVLKQCHVIGAVHVTEAAPFVVFILVSFHVRLLGKPTGAIFVGAGNLAVVFGRFGKLARIHGWCWLGSLGSCR